MAQLAPAFTEESLPIAIGNLFKMNNYDVKYDVHVHGAQVDIVATSKGDPFSKPLYIEATIEYVTNEKYGKDTTKFLLLAKKSPGSHLLCISSRGFSAPVKERALESGVEALSYDELFAKFEKFQPYLTKIINDEVTLKLQEAYEEPLFNDSKGKEPATKWLSYWKGFAPTEAKWLIILGEYGTGKTSLTKVLQYRWLQEYHKDPSSPIPIRIELRNFSRQFDASGLLHHFLDNNGLGHVPIEFMTHLIRTGRVILILDGYDEMAQFMNGRERRACLSALAELAKDGAKGILTSRPNYFSEKEELNVFEALYRKLEQQKYYLSKSDNEVIEHEKAVDSLIERYVLGRYERVLQDLTPEQTKSLVCRSLDGNIIGQKLVLGILAKVFREEARGTKQALSGKPVIIAYLLELVAELQKDSGQLSIENQTEWQIYKLIVDRLMLRDFTRSPLSPAERRKVLQRLAIALSTRGVIVASETVFSEIIDKEFASELRRLSVDERRNRRTELFEDLRSSATLTRSSGAKEDGWVFSHNSLREFLSVEMFVTSLVSRDPVHIEIPISEAMRGFVSAMDRKNLAELWQILGEFWPNRANDSRVGGYLALMWESARLLEGGVDQAFSFLGGSEGHVFINSISIRDIDFSMLVGANSYHFNASGSALSDVNFNGLQMSGANFISSIADTVSFKDCDLSGANFEHSLLYECNLSGALVRDANFLNLDNDLSIIVEIQGDIYNFSDNAALGYLSFHGAVTSSVDDIFVYIHHPKFLILDKICEKVSEQRNSQLRGLTQRGEARSDPPFARALIDKLVGLGWITVDKNELVSSTPNGRPYLQRIVSREAIAPELVEFLKSYNY